MIRVEGYKAFRGTMLISPKTKTVAPFLLSGEWLYKSENDCWYSSGKSYPAEVCKVQHDDDEAQEDDKW